MEKRNDFLDLLRGVAILIVVLGHAIQANYISGRFLSIIWERVILAFQMPLFFAVSGYVLGFSFPNSKPQKFLLSKVYRLLIPYIAWATIHYMFLCIGGITELSVLRFIEELLVSDIWFLRNLFLYNVIVYLVDIFIFRFKLNTNQYVISFILFSFVPILFLLDKIPVLSSYMKEWFYLWFAVGYFAFVLKNKLCIKNDVVNYTITVVLMIGMILMAIYADESQKSLRCVTIVYVIGIVFCLYVYAKHIPRKMYYWFIRLGKSSLAIYVIHVSILHSVPTNKGVYIRIFDDCPMAIGVAVTTIVWLIICQIIIKLIKRYQITNRILLGEKSRNEKYKQ